MPSRPPRTQARAPTPPWARALLPWAAGCCLAAAWPAAAQGQAAAQTPAPVGDQGALLRRIEALTQELQALKAQVEAQAEAQAAQQRLLQASQASQAQLLQQAQQQAQQAQQAQDAQRQATSALQAQVQRQDSRAHERWLGISGDYQLRLDSLRGQALAHTAPQPDGSLLAVPAHRPGNSSLLSQRLGIDLQVRAHEGFSLNARLLMHKAFGDSDGRAASGPFFADRAGAFDGTVGHVPGSTALLVDRLTATWSGLFGEDIWLSVGRRPSTDGAPSHLRLNQRHPGTSGAPALLVDYAFDGITAGWAPEWRNWPGAHVKVCLGRAFEAGYTGATALALRDTDNIGVQVVPLDTDALRTWLRWQQARDLFDRPAIASGLPGAGRAVANLGDLRGFGMGLQGQRKRLGSGDLHYFVEWAHSRAEPNGMQVQGLGLLTGQAGAPGAAVPRSGQAVYLGLRYDLPSRMKLGLEYNRGSRYWLSVVPAGAHSWTSKLGTRGQVGEAYLIQEFSHKPLSSAQARTFMRLGLQWYDFAYTGSNGWLGEPVPLSAVAPGTVLGLVPLSRAMNAYATLEVRF